MLKAKEENLELRLEGANVILRDRRLEDFQEYERWFYQDAEWKKLDTPWIGLATVPRESFLTYTSIPQEKGLMEQRFCLEIESRQGEHIGRVMSWKKSCWGNWPELGLAIWDPENWRLKLGTEALQLWVNYHFQFDTTPRLDLSTWSGNKGMMKLARKLGFKLEACIREAREVEGELYHAVSYGMLRKEWEKQLWATP